MKKLGFYFGIVVGIGTAAAIGWYGWTHRSVSKLRVQTATITEGPIARRVVVAGTLQALKSVDVGCQVSGELESISVDFNSIVKQGQVLAQIDPSLFEAALQNAQAMYEQAQADERGYEVALEDATIKLKRAKTLGERQLMAKADVDAAQIAFDSAKAQVESGKAQVTRAGADVDQAKTNLDHTIITSPVDGIVVNRAVEVGQTVAASFQAPVLFTIAANLQKMQVQALVDESDVGVVKEGADVSFQVESYPDEDFHGKISQVRLQPSTPTAAAAPTGGGPIASSATNGITYTTIIDVPNGDLRLRPGMTATVFLSAADERRVTRIPNTALLFKPSLDLLKSIGESVPPDARPQGDEEYEQVWRYDGKVFTPVAVRIGRADALWAEEISGSLKPGDTVVTNASSGAAPAPPSAKR